MNSARAKSTTFQVLDDEAGVVWSPQGSDHSSSLPQWYVSVRSTPIAELSIRDLSIACRQAVHLDTVVQTAIDRLREDPLAGCQYEGELLAALLSIDSTFWRNHGEEAHRLREIVLESMGRMEEDQRTDAVELLRKVRE